MNHLVSGFARLQSEPPALPLPVGSAPLTDEQWSSWWDAFRETPECEDYFFGERQYAVTFGPDGTFRIEDVLAGRYVLKLPFIGNAGADQPARRAFARVAVVVPAIPGGRSDKPLDIGAIPLEVFPFRELNLGDRGRRSHLGPPTAAGSTSPPCAASSSSSSSGRPPGHGPWATSFTSRRRTTPSVATPGWSSSA